MKRVNAIGLSPNTSMRDVLIACKQMINPRTYQKGPAITTIEKWFLSYFQVGSAVSFSHGRTALYAIMKALEIGRGDEVILQAFTCVVVPNMIVALDAQPIYADITKNLTIDPRDVEKKITKKTKAIIVQHTFGIPADMEALMAIAKKHKISLIEDVAHTIGGTYKGKKLGTFGIASIFSFGRDKAFSSVFGGIAITNDADLGEKLRNFQKNIPFPSKQWIAQQLFHPIAFSVILPTYNSGFGKLILVVLQKLHFLSFPVSRDERKALFSQSLLKRFPNALAILALQQLEQQEKFNSKRIAISQKYQEVCQVKGISIMNNERYPYLRFPLRVANPQAMRSFFKAKRNIYLGDWYAHVLDPRGSDFTAVSYTKGSCPVAEAIACEIINLPTYPSMSDNDVTEVIDLLKQYDTN